MRLFRRQIIVNLSSKHKVRILETSDVKLLIEYALWVNDRLNSLQSWGWKRLKWGWTTIIAFTWTISFRNMKRIYLAIQNSKRHGKLFCCYCKSICGKRESFRWQHTSHHQRYVLICMHASSWVRKNCPIHYLSSVYDFISVFGEIFLCVMDVFVWNEAQDGWNFRWAYVLVIFLLFSHPLTPFLLSYPLVNPRLHYTWINHWTLGSCLWQPCRSKHN